jgi:sec-independent protein translocase protein TatA
MVIRRRGSHAAALDTERNEADVFHPSPMHLLILLVIVLLVVGPKRLPQIARSLGGALRDVRKSVAEDDAPTAEAERRDAALVEARQEPPAPTPEIAEAELAAERETADAGARSTL